MLSRNQNKNGGIFNEGLKNNSHFSGHQWALKIFHSFIGTIFQFLFFSNPPLLPFFNQRWLCLYFLSAAKFQNQNKFVYVPCVWFSPEKMANIPVNHLCMTKFEFLELVLEEDGGKSSLVTEFLKGKRQKNAVRLMTEQVIIQIF